MLSLCLALPLSLAPQEGWTPLELPGLCLEPAPSTTFAPLQGGGHVHLDGRDDASSRGARPLPSAQDVGHLLERAAGAAGRRLELFPFSPPLLVRGGEEDVEWARATLAALDAAGARQRVTLTVWLAPRAGFTPGGEAAAEAGVRSWRSVTRPGEEVAFGERRHEDFIAGYDVNVSTDSGVAAPRVGSVCTGETVHLVASRVQGGRGFHLRGVLDLAELAELEVFDPHTPDLGELHQPRVRTASVAFSGTGRSGELLRVELEGTPLARPDWTLVVRAETEAEPGLDATAGTGWSAIDVSLLAQRPRRLERITPGAGLEGLAALEALAPSAATLTASGVLSAVESRGDPRAGARASGRGPTPYLVGEGFLMVAPEEGPRSLARRLTDFADTVQAPRLDAHRLELRRGGLRVAFPVASGEASRVLVGEERVWLTGYESEIAPNTWMPSPLVEKAFDGLAWQGRCDGRRLSTSLWTSSTEEVTVRDRFQAQLGALQLPRRSVRGASASVELDTGRRRLLDALEDSPAVEIEFLQP